MKKNLIVMGAVLLGSLLALTFACRPLIAIPTQTYTEAALSPDSAIAAPAIRLLRAQGPSGLQALFDANQPLLARCGTNEIKKLSAGDRSAWQRFRAAVDAVGAQRDCAASRLYWYTTLDEARIAAKAAGKPILSLRLLGRLNEEYSCANSRFFRTTLYANAEVSAYLRTHFILHWQSVRPVPRITIDFGDGRKIERTITGNSIHYILNADGRAIDALPGLYGSRAFLKGLADAEHIARETAALTGWELDEQLRKYHREYYAATAVAWGNDLKLIASTTPIRVGLFSPTTSAAGRLTASKAAVESPLLDSLQATDDATWARIAQLHAGEVELDAAAVKLLTEKYPTAGEASVRAFTKVYVEKPLVTALRNLRSSIGEDTVRNEYLFHAQIHEWFMNGTAPTNLGKLNSLIYAKLFLTPDSDPWLGLVPANTISALDDDGLVEPTNGIER